MSESSDDNSKNSKGQSTLTVAATHVPLWSHNCKVPGKETRAWERRQSFTSHYQMNCIPRCSRNAILTQSVTRKITAWHMLTSEHLCNYWRWSSRYQLRNLQCEAISSTWRKRKRFLCRLAKIVQGLCVRRRITQGKVKGGGGSPS